jgi:hypothetical protein
MSRTIITAVVAVVIAALTAIAFFVSNISFDDRVRKDADAQLTRAYQLIQRLNQLQGIDVSNKAERLASRPEFVTAIKSGSQNERANQARLGFQKFMADEKSGTVKPDIIALVDAQGDLLAMHEVGTVVPRQWRNEAKDEANPTKVPTILPALNVVLGKRVIISDIWNHDGVKKVGVAPIIDPEVSNPKDPDGVVIIGAIVVAYAQTAKNAQNDRALLGTEIAYYDNNKVVASSFTRSATSTEEDTAKASEVSELLASAKLSESASKQKVTIDGIDYYAAAVKMPRSYTKSLPDKYPPVTAGAVVLAPFTPTEGALAKSLFILLLGGGSLAIAILGIYLTHRRLVAQTDQIEQGVTDIINGNVDRTFRPVGPELDGLANGLNVMLARLLGRPEPGEEEFDDEGNPIIPGRVDFDEGEEGSRPAPDPDLAALAQESEPDYYKRVFTEYQAARKAAGATDDGSFENFIAKLKVNEGKLKAQYQCRAVRFRVVTKDGKVSLKPVPIFA